MRAIEDDRDTDRPDLSDPVRAFGALFDRHARALHGYLRRRVGDLADDLVAETFLVAYQSRAGYDPARGTARAWLHGIAANLLRRHLRQEVRGLRAFARAGVDVTGDGAADDHGGRVAERVDAAVAARRLAGALAALEPGDRDVLLLTSWAGLDATEVAGALGIPAGTVRSRLHRVRGRLRAHGVEEER
ncbi:sigma-70 family RNA polymerase sigma factor [Actinosynnema pretiosum subsp. pretiosum]